MQPRLFSFLSIVLLLYPLKSPASEWKRLRIAEQIDIQVEAVFSREEHIQGLSGRFSLPEGSGMVFMYDQTGERIFWMIKMHFALDIIWIRDERIVHIEHSVPPAPPGVDDRVLRRYGHGISADTVLELPAGYSKKKSITIGNRVKFLP